MRQSRNQIFLAYSSDILRLISLPSHTKQSLVYKGLIGRSSPCRPKILGLFLPTLQINIPSHPCHRRVVDTHIPVPISAVSQRKYIALVLTYFFSLWRMNACCHVCVSSTAMHCERVTYRIQYWGVVFRHTSVIVDVRLSPLSHSGRVTG